MDSKKRRLNNDIYRNIDVKKENNSVVRKRRHHETDLTENDLLIIEDKILQQELKDFYYS